MKLEFGYGEGVQAVEIPKKNLLAVLAPQPMTHERVGQEAVLYALEHPIGSARLREIVKAGQKVAVITSDISRPFPSYQVLPFVLKELYNGGVSREDITVVFALGSHRNHTEEEMIKLVGESCYQQVKCVDSDMRDCIHLGETAGGTPVDITRTVAEADVKVCLGNIEFHYFAGYSGGAKAIMPGVSTKEAISANHRMMTGKDACAGRLKDNPVRMDIEDAGEILGIDFIVNVVLDEHKQIVYCVAGQCQKAHRKGCSYLDKMYRRPIEKQADIVIVSPGGAPKDATLYQAQKALENAKYAVREGGTIILIGACREGMGSEAFTRWLTQAPTADSMVEKIQRKFELGGHKAAAIAMVLKKAGIDLVCELPDDFVRSIFMTPRPCAQAAFDDAMKRHGNEAGVIAMPYGTATLPIVKA